MQLVQALRKLWLLLLLPLATVASKISHALEMRKNTMKTTNTKAASVTERDVAATHWRKIPTKNTKKTKYKLHEKGWVGG